MSAKALKLAEIEETHSGGGSRNLSLREIWRSHDRPLAILEAAAGIEPARGSFADSSVTTSPCRQCAQYNPGSVFFQFSNFLILARASGPRIFVGIFVRMFQ